MQPYLFPSFAVIRETENNFCCLYLHPYHALPQSSHILLFFLQRRVYNRNESTARTRIYGVGLEDTIGLSRSNRTECRSGPVAESSAYEHGLLKELEKSCYRRGRFAEDSRELGGSALRRVWCGKGC